MKQKLLLTINSLRSGGAERVVSQLLRHTQDDVEIHLALMTKVIQYDIPSDTRVIDMKQSESDSPLMMLLRLPFLSYKLARYCKQNNISHSVAFLNRPSYINAMMRKWWGYKGRVVVCERIHQSAELQTYGWMKRSITRIMVKYAYRSADRVLANSKLMKADLDQHFSIHKPVEVIYNPIDIADLEIKMHEEPEVQFDPSFFHFVSVGNFREEKNYPLLINAFAGMKDPGCRLMLVGSGMMEKEMRRMVNELGITSQVIFCGRDSNPFKYLRKSDCFVVNADVEGFPNVLLEALACGKPAIATDCKSGPRELLAPGTDIFYQLKTDYSVEQYGILTPVGNVAALTQAMTRMRTDHALREKFRQSARGRAGEFDVSIIRQYFLKAFLG